MALTIQQAFDLASQHHRAGRLQEAETLYRQVLAQQPSHAGALHGLGMLARQVGQTGPAIELLRRAISSNPSLAEAHFDLGNILFQSGQAAEAVTELRRAT